MVSEAPVSRRVSSTPWSAASPPDISVVVATYGREPLLAGLVAALEGQDLSPDRYEVAIVDNGSDDGTWSRLEALARSTPCRLVALRLEHNVGPGGARNVGVAHTSAGLVAFTDDDCLPTPGWLAALLPHFDGPVLAVQGRVRRPPEAPPTPWSHTVVVGGLTPFFETANVAYRRKAFVAAGGFGDDDLSHRPGRPAFGEDALLGDRIVGRWEGRAFASDAVVVHRWQPRRYRSHLRYQRDFSSFAALVDRSSTLRRSRRLGAFLSADTARADLLAVSLAGLVLTRRPVWVLGVWPWLRRAWPSAGWRAGGRLGPRQRILAGDALAAVSGVAWRVVGSVRHRRLSL